jgi:hypothetical protein
MQKLQIGQFNQTQIQNTLDLGATNYVGLSATGPYSIWAGSTASGGNSTANFSSYTYW